MTSTADLYTRAWTPSSAHAAGSSHAIVVPLLQELLAPKSVVDVGCGIGNWLAEFRARGVDDIVGIEGHWIDDDSGGSRASMLRVSRDRLIPHDLEQPLHLDRKFDLALSLEVAEHLPAEAAPQLVRTLTELAPVVMFSAAVPYQGGTGHVNERWPSYWAGLFDTREFLAIDCLRPAIWSNPSVAWYYRQNLLLFVSESALSDYPNLSQLRERLRNAPLDVVHPDRYVALARSSLRRGYDQLRDRMWFQAPRAAQLVARSKRRFARRT